MRASRDRREIVPIGIGFAGVDVESVDVESVDVAVVVSGAGRQMMQPINCLLRNSR